MRAAAFRTPVIAGAVGAVGGCLVALAGQWWVSRNATNDFGWYSSSPLVDVNGITVHRTLADGWVDLLWPAALAGLVVGVVGALASTVRRGGVRSFPRGGCGFVALAAIGVVLGGVVGGGALMLRTGSGDEVTYHGRYVDFSNVDASQQGSYSSFLTVTVDGEPGWTVLLVCGGTGLAAGVLAGGVTTIARRRGMSRGTVGAA